MTVSEILKHEKTIEMMMNKTREIAKVDINLQLRNNLQQIKIL